MDQQSLLEMAKKIMGGAQTLITRPPGYYGQLDPGSALGAYHQNPEQAMMDAPMMVGSVKPLGNRYAWILDQGWGRLRNTLPADDFQALDMARDILNNKTEKSKNIKNLAVNTIDTLAEHTVGRDVIEKYKGNSMKLANWIANNIKPERNNFDIPNLLEGRGIR